MFITSQSLFFLFFLFQWIWGPPPVYAGETRSQVSSLKPLHKAYDTCLSSPTSLKGKLKEETFRLFPNDLMEHEEWILLKGLDSLCADTWCEGSFDFRFQAFKCSFKEQKCMMFYRSQDQTAEYSSQKPFSFICVITAWDRKDLFGTERDFWISFYLYSGVTECIQQSERWISEG